MRFAVLPGFDAKEAAALGASSDDAADAALVLSMQPDGAFCARAPDDSALGIVTCAVWDRLAWIGNLLVAPDVHGEGIGRELLRAALTFADARADVVGLDTAPGTHAMFEAEGFAAVGESALWTRATTARPPAQPSEEYAIYPVSPAEMMELVQCDTPRFGAPRGRYLATLVAAEPHRSFVAIHRKTGAFSGHALGLRDRIGPLIADTPAAAAWLLHAVERGGTPGRAIVAGWNPHVDALFHEAGYEPEASPRVRMLRGARALPGRAETHYTVGSWGLG